MIGTYIDRCTDKLTNALTDTRIDVTGTQGDGVSSVQAGFLNLSSADT